MKITGKVIEKLPLKQGTSANGAWSIASLVVEFLDGQYTSKVCLQNSKRAADFDAIAVGSEGDFEFSVSSRKSNMGSWFTSCNCYKWTLSSAAKQESTTEEKPDLPF